MNLIVILLRLGVQIFPSQFCHEKRVCDRPGGIVARLDDLFPQPLYIYPGW